jgi:hypothetical protein
MELRTQLQLQLVYLPLRSIPCVTVLNNKPTIILEARQLIVFRDPNHFHMTQKTSTRNIYLDKVNYLVGSHVKMPTIISKRYLDNENTTVISYNRLFKSAYFICPGELDILHTVYKSSAAFICLVPSYLDLGTSNRQRSGSLSLSAMA